MLPWLGSDVVMCRKSDYSGSEALESCLASERTVTTIISQQCSCEWEFSVSMNCRAAI